MTDLHTTVEERLASIEAKVDLLLVDREDAKKVAKSQWYHSGALAMVIGYVGLKAGILPH